MTATFFSSHTYRWVTREHRRQIPSIWWLRVSSEKESAGRRWRSSIDYSPVERVWYCLIRVLFCSHEKKHTYHPSVGNHRDEKYRKSTVSFWMLPSAIASVSLWSNCREDRPKWLTWQSDRNEVHDDRREWSISIRLVLISADRRESTEEDRRQTRRSMVRG